jgi:hypothetical protein
VPVGVCPRPQEYRSSASFVASSWARDYGVVRCMHGNKRNLRDLDGCVCSCGVAELSSCVELTGLATCQANVVSAQAQGPGRVTSPHSTPQPDHVGMYSHRSFTAQHGTLGAASAEPESRWIELPGSSRTRLSWRRAGRARPDEPRRRADQDERTLG